jgi:adenylate kinase
MTPRIYNLVFIGPPGSGKGTVAKELSQQLNIPHLSTGDLIRAEIKRQTPLGKKVEELVQSGTLVDDATISAVLESRLSRNDCLAGFILDGYPRNANQAEILFQILKKSKRELTDVIQFNVPKEMLAKRLSGRYNCPNCGKIYNINTPELAPKNDTVCDSCNEKLFQRPDDQAVTVEKRLQIYNDAMQPMLDYYKEQKLLLEFDASNTISENFENLKKLLGL